MTRRLRDVGNTRAFLGLGILLTSACSGGSTTTAAPTGAPTVGPKPPVVMPAGEIEAVRVAPSFESTCVLLVDQTVWCWGGENDNSSSTDDGRLKQMPLPPVATIDAAGERTFAVTTTGELWFWGTEGEQKPEYVTATVPVRVDLPKVLDVAVGGLQVCARLEDDVDCWDKKRRVHRRLGVRADAVAVRANDVCVLSGGEVTCFVGESGGDKRTLAVKDATDLAGTHRMVCALTARGTVECDGDDDAVRAMKDVLKGDRVARLRGTALAITVDAANDPKSFSDGILLCGEEDSFFVRFKNAKGEEVAVIGRTRCSTSFTPMLPRDVGMFVGPARDFLAKLGDDLMKQDAAKRNPEPKKPEPKPPAPVR